MYNHKQDMPLT